MRRAIVLLIFWLAPAVLSSAPSPAALIESVERVGMTVSNMDRSVTFFENVLTFEKVSDEEVSGDEYDKLQGVFGLRMRIVRMRLGSEEIELTEYLTPRGRPVPIDSRSNDRWFQHVAIIVSDMSKAYARLREHNVEHASPEPQRLPDWNPAAASRPSTSRTRTVTHSKSSSSRTERATRSGTRRMANSSLASITRRSSCPIRRRAYTSIRTSWASA